jgi:very-short-patch-repair endonuclease
LKEKLPALIPQVYLHYDPYTSKQLKGEKRLSRERMDFLLLLPYRKNIVIEIDGQQHYSENGKASPKLYAEMVAEDRRLRLAGYELYRFGGDEFVDDAKAKQTVKNFFDDLFKLHSIL